MNRWLNTCRNLRPLDFNPNNTIRPDISSAKRGGYLPISLKTKGRKHVLVQYIRKIIGFETYIRLYRTIHRTQHMFVGKSAFLYRCVALTDKLPTNLQLHPGYPR